MLPYVTSMSGRRLSLAPTLMQFFAAASEPTDAGSIDAVGIAVGAVVASREADHAILVVPDEVVDLEGTLRVGQPGRRCAPGIGVHSGAVVLIRRLEQVVKIDGNPTQVTARVEK